MGANSLPLCLLYVAQCRSIGSLAAWRKRQPTHWYRLTGANLLALGKGTRVLQGGRLSMLRSAHYFSNFTLRKYPVEVLRHMPGSTAYLSHPPYVCNSFAVFCSLEPFDGLEMSPILLNSASLAFCAVLQLLAMIPCNGLVPARAELILASLST